MRGSVVHRGKNRYALVLDLGYVVNKEEGTRRRKQKWISFKGTKKEAGDKLTELVRAANRNEFVEPTKLTVGEWLDEWLTKIVKPARRPNTHKSYESIVNHNLKPALGPIPLQQLKPADLQRYIAEHSTLSAATLRLHHCVMSGALRSAMKNGLVTRNVAGLVEGLPQIERRDDAFTQNVLDVDEARRLLAAAKEAGPRIAAFYALALDSGARVGELAGLKWTDVDLDSGKISIVRQLATSVLANDGSVQFGPTKTGRSRSVEINASTVTLLKAHKSHQAEVKLKNRTVYKDHGLVFAKEHPDLLHKHDTLGTPIQTHNINTGEFAKLLKAANVRRITFHGLRHTSATLLLMSGEPINAVSTRLGHKRASMTLDVYGHVLPSAGRSAADRLGALLHG